MPCTAALQRAWMLTFDIPQGEVSIAGSFRGEVEGEAMSRLGLVSVHHTDGVNQLRRTNQKKVQIQMAQILKITSNKCKMVIKYKSSHVAPDTSLPVTPHLPLSAAGVKFAGLVSSRCCVLIIWVALVTFAFGAVEQR